MPSSEQPVASPSEGKGMSKEKREIAEMIEEMSEGDPAAGWAILQDICERMRKETDDGEFSELVCGLTCENRRYRDAMEKALEKANAWLIMYQPKGPSWAAQVRDILAKALGKEAHDGTTEPS